MKGQSGMLSAVDSKARMRCRCSGMLSAVDSKAHMWCRCSGMLSAVDSKAHMWWRCSGMLSSVDSKAHMWCQCSGMLSAVDSKAHMWCQCSGMLSAVDSKAHMWCWCSGMLSAVDSKAHMWCWCSGMLSAVDSKAHMWCKNHVKRSELVTKLAFHRKTTDSMHKQILKIKKRHYFHVQNLTALIVHCSKMKLVKVYSVNMAVQFQIKFSCIVTPMMCCITYLLPVWVVHTLRIHHAHAEANLNWWYSKYAKVACVYYFCTIALRTLSHAWVKRRVHSCACRIDSFDSRVICILR